MQGLGAFIITYRRTDYLKSTFAAIARQTAPPEYLVVFDNAADETVRQFVVDAARSFPGTLLYETTGENLGPAGAALLSIKRLLALGCEYIHWIDDDDPPRQKDVSERLVHLLSADESIGCVGTAGNYFDWRTGRVGRIDDALLQSECIDVDMVAGCNDMVLSRRPLEAGVLPNADLFFGFEDWDLCWRLKRAGFRVVVSGPLLRERRAASHPAVITRFWNVKSLEIDEWRVYLAQRNFAYLMAHEYRAYVPLLMHVLRELAKGLVAMVKISPRKGSELIRITLHGWIEGLRSHLGPRNPLLVCCETDAGDNRRIYASMKPRLCAKSSDPVTESSTKRSSSSGPAAGS